MDPRWIAILLVLPLMAGCLSVDEDIPDPKEGDLKLTITLSKTLISPGEGNVSLTIELKNVCDHDLMVEELFAFGGGLFPRVHASNGSWVELSYPLYDHEPRYSLFHPGETKIVTETLLPIWIEIDGTERDFNWNISGSYSLSVTWWGIGRSTFNVTSNTEYLTVGDYLDPQEGDLSFTISMDQYIYPTKPEHLNLTMVLKNVCDHPIRVEDNLWIGYTISGYAISPNGTKIVFFPSYYPDYSQHYAPLYPGKSLRRTEDITDYSNWERIDGSICEWDQTGTYTLTMVWSGVKYSNFSVISNEIAITIR